MPSPKQRSYSGCWTASKRTGLGVQPIEKNRANHRIRENPTIVKILFRGSTRGAAYGPQARLLRNSAPYPCRRRAADGRQPGQPNCLYHCVLRRSIDSASTRTRITMRGCPSRIERLLDRGGPDDHLFAFRALHDDAAGASVGDEIPAGRRGHGEALGVIVGGPTGGRLRDGASGTRGDRCDCEKREGRGRWAHVRVCFQGSLPTGR